MSKNRKNGGGFTTEIVETANAIPLEGSGFENSFTPDFLEGVKRKALADAGIVEAEEVMPKTQSIFENKEFVIESGNEFKGLWLTLAAIREFYVGKGSEHVSKGVENLDARLNRMLVGSNATGVHTADRNAMLLEAAFILQAMNRIHDQNDGTNRMGFKVLIKD